MPIMRDLFIDHVRTRAMSSIAMLKAQANNWEGKLYAYAVLDLMITKADEAKESIRKQLLEEIPKMGKSTDERPKNPNYTYEIDGFTVSRESRVSKTPEVKALMKLLEKYNVPIEAACNEVRSWEPDPGKIEFLINSGKLKLDEVEPLHKVQLAVVLRHKDEFKTWLRSQDMLDKKNPRSIPL